MVGCVADPKSLHSGQELCEFWACRISKVLRCRVRGNFGQLEAFGQATKGALADPFADSPNSAAIFAQEAPCARWGAILAASTATCGLPQALSFRPGVPQYRLDPDCSTRRFVARRATFRLD